MTPATLQGDRAQSRYEAALGATAILVACERHRRKLGDWAASIDAIDPSILPSPPLDPFSGRPYRMERRDGQILVTSRSARTSGMTGVRQFDPSRFKKDGPDDVAAVAWDVPLRRQPPPPAGQGPKPED